MTKGYGTGSYGGYGTSHSTYGDKDGKPFPIRKDTLRKKLTGLWKGTHAISRYGVVEIE